MAKKSRPLIPLEVQDLVAPVVAATLASTIYHARMLNRQSKLNIPEQEVIDDVLYVWRRVVEAIQGNRSK